MPDNFDFFKERQDAINRMKEMARHSEEFGIPAPSFAKRRGEQNKKHDNPLPKSPPEKPQRSEGFLHDLLKGFNLPFFQGENDNDITLILALLLLLLDKSEDKLLLYALVYIML